MRHAPAAVVASISLALAAAAMPGASAGHTVEAGLGAHPNVVVILLDDATARDVAAMPAVQSLIAEQGTTFTRAYVPEPLCCPARATILTGLYPHNHRVLDNVAPLGGYTAFDDSHTIATYLDHDYRTGLFGKYLNDNDTQGDYVPPGWDAFKMPTAKSTYHFVGPREWVNGVKEWFSGMASTTLYVQQAKAFISRAAAADKPFFAFVPVVAPHIGAPHDDYPDEPGKTTWVPPEFRYTAPRTGVDDPSVNEADVSDKPGSIADKPRLTPRQLDAIAERDAQRTEALEGADRDVASLIEQLDFLGVLDDTYVILASDNGFMQGQHRIQVGKDQPYEPAAHVPLIIRGTGFPVGSRYGRVTGLQDITPTILSMTHERATAQVDGLSLLDLVDGARTPSKRPQLIEIPVTARFSDNAIQAGANVSPAEARRLEPVSWHARGLVTTSGWKYIEYPQSGEAELYDLNDDPYELRNLAGDPDFSVKVARMSSRLHQWWHCDGKACG